MPSNLEIMSILANEVFVKDNTVLKSEADILAVASGVQKVWFGQEVEEVRAYLAISAPNLNAHLRDTSCPDLTMSYAAWDSLRDHESFMAGEGNVDKVRGSLEPIIARGATRDMINAHFEVEGVPFSVLSAPVTEFGIVTPKAGYEADMKNILTKLSAFSESVAVGDVFAPVVEKEGFVFASGRLEQHRGEVYEGFIDSELLAYAEVSFSHVKLLQHEGA